MLATINSLPNELFTEIFQYIFVSLSVHEWYRHTLPDLRLVSRRWNATIEHSPSLWTSILVTEKSASASTRDLPTYFQSTSTRLARSWKLPLHITIDLSTLPDPDGFAKMEASQLGRIVRQEAPRLVSLKLRAKSRFLYMAVLSRMTGTAMPKLRSFTHIGCEDPELGGAESFAPFVEEGSYINLDTALLQDPDDQVDRNTLNQWGEILYPVLESVELVGVMFQHERFPIMRSIRRLCIRGQPLDNRPSTITLLGMLESARNTLEVLELEDEIRLDAMPFVPPIVLDKLLVFSLGYEDPKQVINFLLSLRMPALTDLTITYTSAKRSSFKPRLSGHRRLLRTFIQHFPLAQMKRLSLNGVVLSNNIRALISIPPSADGLTAQQLHYFSEELGLKEFAPIFGHWRVPSYILFLFKCRTLEHLSLDDVRSIDDHANPKQVIGAYCQNNGSLSSLRTCHIDGSPDGLFVLLSSLEEDGRVGNRPSALQVSLGEELKSALSEGEREQLEDYWQRSYMSKIP